MVSDPADDTPSSGPASSGRVSSPPSDETSAGPASSREVPAEVLEAEPVDPIEEAQGEARKMKDQWMRTAADFDNFRKRSRREIEDARKSGREDILREFLPVFDNLERALSSAQRASDIKGVAEGLSMVMKQFEGTLGRVGITKVPSVGQPFDPSIHEAIQQVETDEHPPGQVVAEVQPGYMQGDKLVRAAMVVVAKPKSETSQEPQA